ncbi:ergothioneine biosynthesis glutamate--cysteine ligase EgtA [Streptomyces sp. 8K308]|uniref:ergothioneine biosynthesis glutamate--cysteine ligase EgtA n=1 Tax=Streptomyces sp. 8K308 TaxID=2530388 RepID=UPI001052C065|nr:ergothioneine biosynthesis glutamate--cysteine ligase EgtA [Streptomyces sp. 8K308]TDC05215.1 ergothioneine biosynthesis glutamate--cysteine ligase EgtA [Streptomyces sp. 8K308]
MAWDPTPATAASAVEADEPPGPLSSAEAEAHVRRTCFAAAPPLRTGVELEWLVHDRSDPGRLVPPEALEAALAPLAVPGALPGGSRVTREPGGQVELSGPPATSLVGCVGAAADDVAALRHALAAAGLTPVGLGLDPHRVQPRVLDAPRYRAMEAYFDHFGPGGRIMMRATASVQVCVDAGDESDGPSGYRARWALAHRIGPLLVAAFANSPLLRGRPTGWKSTRQALWARIDPGRTRPPEHGCDGDPRTAWAGYALDASLLCVRRDPPAPWTAPRARSFRSWLRGPHRHPERPPALADLDYHLSTLFPPVRPRGWLELRMIDAQSGDDWLVPVTVVRTLLDDPVAAEAAHRATEPLTGDDGRPRAEYWLRAARHGPADPLLGPAVRACLAAAESALARDPADARLRAAVGRFADRYAERDRCPADDHLDRVDRPARPPLEGARHD